MILFDYNFITKSFYYEVRYNRKNATIKYALCSIYKDMEYLLQYGYYWRLEKYKIVIPKSFTVNIRVLYINMIDFEPENSKSSIFNWIFNLVN